MNGNYALYPFKQILYMPIIHVRIKTKHDQKYTKALLIDLQIFK